VHQLRVSVANFRVKDSLSTRGAAPSEINSGVGMLMTGAQGDGVAGGVGCRGPLPPAVAPTRRTPRSPPSMPPVGL